MKNSLIILALIIVLTTGAFYLRSKKTPSQNIPSTPTHPSANITKDLAENETIPTTTVIVENLDTPWELAFLPDKSLFITERPGTVRRVDAQGILDSTFSQKISAVHEIGEGGLLGIAIHPDFSKNHYVYFYYTYSSRGDDTLNRVVRMTFVENKLTNEKIIVDNIPSASNHNGGRIKFGPDNYLYVGTGDAQEPSQAQNTNTLGGKILRVTDEGKAAPGNPFNNEVYSYGHRNVQGLAWDKAGNLWATEHGRSGFASGLDELNLIQPGKNYGWPDIEGDETAAGIESPKKHSGAANTWAPSGIAFINNALYFGGLRGQSLYEAVTNGTSVTDFKEHFVKEYGRVRDVVIGPDSMIYMTTSNQDGRGTPNNGDDKVIRVNPEKL